MRYILLRLIIIPLSFLIKTVLPIVLLFQRVYYTASLMAKVKDLDSSVQCDGKIYITGTRNICIGNKCRLGMETELRTMENGYITLGNEIRLNRGCTITSYSKISIGDFTIIGEYASIRDANHGMIKGEPMRYQPHTTSPITIGNDVWIGRGSCILPGVSIGDGAVIGANSVVTNNVPSFSIVAGNPARIIRER
jgi:acetyltransferase-like isoleucine patch superfamily enzyme